MHGKCPKGIFNPPSQIRIAYIFTDVFNFLGVSAEPITVFNWCLWPWCNDRGLLQRIRPVGSGSEFFRIPASTPLYKLCRYMLPQQPVQLAEFVARTMHSLLIYLVAKPPMFAAKLDSSRLRAKILLRARTIPPDTQATDSNTMFSLRSRYGWYSSPVCPK